MPYNRHYAAIRAHYGDRRAERSQLPLLNHIHEGVQILLELGAPLRAMEAFCLHPLLQADPDLQTALTADSPFQHYRPDPAAVLLAMEYRRVANAYLSCHYQGNADPIGLSCLTEVNQMLIADKVQNRKDFELHHAGGHGNRIALAAYFKNWLNRLGVSEARYQALRQRLATVDGPPMILEESA